MEPQLCLAVYLLSTVSLFVPVISRGAGRAFPIESENYITSTFQQINPSIDWDETNFLVDLSGLYANCDALKQPRGTINVDRKTRDGATVGGIVDTIQGAETHVGATTNYIAEIIKRWNSSQLYNDLIKRSVKFGCSVRPGCDGYVVVACLFGSAQRGDNYVQTTTRPVPSTARPWTTRSSTTTTTVRPSTAERLVVTRTERPLFTGEVRALAFTNEQYKVAEQIIERTWDPSHYLENLSGYETDCYMIGTRNWPFDHTQKFNRHSDMDIKGLYGYAVNRGSTPDALNQILPSFKQTIQAANFKDLGCSLIPDCIEENGSTMYVVVSCLYEI
jgi:hypothetical protein